MTKEKALAMAGHTTWASHSREQVDAALSVLAARVRELEAQREQDIEAAYYRGYHDGACDPDIDVLCKAMDEKGGSE